MLDDRDMFKHVVLASVVFALASIVACKDEGASVTPNASETDGAATAQCVDFVVAESELACTIASDCTFVDATRVCPGDPSCGGQLATNRAGRARFDRETGAIARMQVLCGAPAPEECVQGRCVVCTRPDDCRDAN